MINYYGIEQSGGKDFYGSWKPIGVVGIPDNIEDGYKTLRSVLPDHLRAVPLNPTIIETWKEVIADKRVVDLVSLIATLKILSA